jgi:acetoacetyl-CoA synthetase
MLWEFADQTNITLFGTSANYLLACRSNNVQPNRKYRLEHLRSIGSTASPLPPEGFEWVYRNVKSDVWLNSCSGGTDVCTAIVGGTPLLPVYSGEIQGPLLGVNAKAFDENGHPVINDVGELVVTDPMPSMPIYFWNDANHERYLESYFRMYPNVWRHGDWIKFTDRGSCQIYGRSDSTINRGGVRIGTSEIYSAVEDGEDVKDSLVIDIDDGTGKLKMLLFVVLREGVRLDEELKNRIKRRVRENCSPRHVPDEIHEISEVPRTLNGKKLEVPLKRILMGVPVEKAVNSGVMANPESIHYFVQLAETLKRKS